MSEKQDLSISIDSALYRVTTPSEQTTQYGEQTNSVTAVSSTPAPYRVGGPLALLIAVGGLGSLGFLQSSGCLSLSDSELMWLAFHDDREDFDDWITTIRLPDEAFDRPRAEADSLASLVDLAIDTDNSVIEDPDEDGYYVIHDEYLYTYVPPAADNDSQDSEASSETDAVATVTGSDGE
ncbi:hypothetical protein CP556_14875 [Natrinema sp. CBA1119]|uniref:DUF5305 family protein n=1 Tax=Natrinema sp. CBA1119 TaxID=1608465 RepID=UPI000BFA3939|nr:DUF5305 family protein [Natrinema sp. CBA1119]PGF17254.1 hypothetical protein CP556_14875 [Natrinema sp. CBA1119]